MGMVVKFGGRYNIDLDVSYEARADITASEIAGAKEEHDDFCKFIEQWIREGIDSFLNPEELSVRVTKEAKYFRIDLLNIEK